MSKQKNKTKSRGSRLSTVVSALVVVALLSTAFVGTAVATDGGDSSGPSSLGDAICSDNGGDNIDSIENIINSGLQFLITLGGLVAGVLAIVVAFSNNVDVEIGSWSANNWYEPVINYVTLLLIIVGVQLGFDIVFGIDLSCMIPGI